MLERHQEKASLVADVAQHGKCRMPAWTLGLDPPEEWLGFVDVQGQGSRLRAPAEQLPLTIRRLSPAYYAHPVGLGDACSVEKVVAMYVKRFQSPVFTSNLQ